METPFFFFPFSIMTLTYIQLLFDLDTAYLDARRHKREKKYQVEFEANLNENLLQLAQELYTHVLTRRNPHQLNSYLGILSHYSAYHLTKSLFYPIHGKGGYFTKWMKKWVEYPR